MKHVIFINESQLPHVISQNSNDYPFYEMGGYEIIFEGTKKQCNEKAAEMLQELCEFSNLEAA